MRLTRLHRGIATGLLGLALAALPACEFWNELTQGQGADGGAQAGDKDLTASDRQLSGAMEGVYKYTDSAGVVHFVDSAEKIPPRYRKKAVHPTGGAITVLPSSPIDEILEKEKIDPTKYAQQPGAARPAAAASGPVIMYSTTWCPVCTRARDHLRRRGVSFVEKDVERDRAALEEMLRKTGGARGVPALDVHGTIMSGYSPQALDRALGK